MRQAVYADWLDLVLTYAPLADVRAVRSRSTVLTAGLTLDICQGNRVCKTLPGRQQLTLL